MNNQDIFADIIIQFCDESTIGNLARVSRMHYSVIREPPIYLEFKQYYVPGDSFVKVCQADHLHIARWMQSRIDIFKEDADWLFTNICRKGQLDMAKWLHSINLIDYHRPNWTFGVTVFKHLHIGKWLLQTLDIPLHSINWVLEDAKKYKRTDVIECISANCRPQICF